MADNKGRDTDAGDKDADAGREDAGGGAVTLDQVRDIVREVLGSSGARPADGGVAAQVEAAVRKVHKGAKDEEERERLTQRVAALESKKEPEKKPKQYRTITRRIWGDDDD